MSTDALPPVDPASLPDDVRLLKSLVVELVATLRTRDERIAQLERNMDLLARKVFGRTSEKVDPRQTVLFEQPAEEPGRTAAARSAERRPRACETPR